MTEWRLSQCHQSRARIADSRTYKTPRCKASAVLVFPSHLVHLCLGPWGHSSPLPCSLPLHPPSIIRVEPKINMSPASGLSIWEVFEQMQMLKSNSCCSRGLTPVAKQLLTTRMPLRTQKSLLWLSLQFQSVTNEPLCRNPSSFAALWSRLLQVIIGDFELRLTWQERERLVREDYDTTLQPNMLAGLSQKKKRRKIQALKVS